MDLNKPTTHKVSPDVLEKLLDFLRRNGKPQTIEALTRRYIELLREKEARARQQ